MATHHSYVLSSLAGLTSRDRDRDAAWRTTASFASDDDDDDDDGGEIPEQVLRVNPGFRQCLKVGGGVHEKSRTY